MSKLGTAKGFEVPVLFLIFNRVETTSIVFGEIKKQQPKKLFIAADGPREHVQGEREQCLLTRNIVLNGIDWDCEVKTLLRENNLGCGRSVSLAIDWFFEHVDEGIVIEDDCLPESGFFSFCEELLEKYRDHQEIMHISVNNFQQGIERGDGSYYFSRLTHIWGWATWKRAWEKYDFTLARYRNHSTKDVHPKFCRLINQVLNGSLDTWDIQWVMAVWWNDGITITPQVNLVKNIGYGTNKKATHTKARPPKWVRKMKYGNLSKVIHPKKVCVDKDADDFTLETVYTDSLIKSIAKKILRKN